MSSMNAIGRSMVSPSVLWRVPVSVTSIVAGASTRVSASILPRSTPAV